MKKLQVYLWGAVLLLLAGAVQSAEVSVTGAWLEQHLDDPDLVLIDMSADSNQYQRFHLPGAVSFHNQYLLQRRSDGVMMQIPEQRLVQLLGLLGIDRNKRVIIYDDLGGLQAGRLFWALEQIGHPRVSVLDGGLVRWILDGRKVVNDPVQPKPVQYQISGQGRQNVITADEVKQLLGGSDTKLVDVRSEQEYAGSPRDPRSGHIPGAVWWPWQQGVDFDKGFVATDSDKLRKSLASLGITPDKPVVLYCRTGHRASQAYYTLRKLGFENLRMYDGSMQEWSKRADLPVRSGMKP